MKSLVFILSFLLGTTVISQTSLPVFSSPENNLSIAFKGNAFYQSTSIFNEFSNKFIYGGEITNEIKNNSFAKHRLNNRIGGGLFGEVDVLLHKFPIKKCDNLGLVFRAGWNMDAGAGYTEEEFGLVFYGNENYLGQELSLSGTEFNNYAFQKIGFGVLMKNNSSIVVNYINASSVQRGYIFDGSLTHAADASQIDLDITGEFLTTRGSKFSQGKGIGLDADFYVPVKVGINTDTTNSVKLHIMIRNVGAVRLTENPYTYSMDTTLSYSGFRFNQFTQGKSIFGDSQEVLDSIGVEKDSSNRWVMLPAHFQVAKIVDVHSTKRWQSFFGFRVITGMPASPQVYGGAHFRINEHFNTGAQLSYGGYGGINGGFYFTSMFDKINFSIGTENIVGLSKRYGRGASLQFKTAIIL